MRLINEMIRLAATDLAADCTLMALRLERELYKLLGVQPLRWRCRARAHGVGYVVELGGSVEQRWICWCADATGVPGLFLSYFL